MTMYPLLFEPTLLEKVWGGHSIHHWKYGTESQKPIGESWEIFSENVIRNGEYAGLTLQSLIDANPQCMIGSNESEEFPLLVKILDAKEWLSVQVHPDDALALELEGESRGKTECWYILHADEEACIQYDIKHDCTIGDYADAIDNGQPKRCLEFLPVKAGDIIYVPAGTVHAIGPGIMLYELQQTSDTTYRLYDWDRVGLDGKPRELHIEKGLLCSKPGSGRYPYPVREALMIDGNCVLPLIRETYFTLDKVSLGKQPFSLAMNGKAALLTNIGKHDVYLTYGAMSITLPIATSAFLPAALEHVSIGCEEQDQSAQVLIAAQNDI